MSNSFQEILEEVLPMIRRKDHVLDVGSGVGRQALVFAQKGAHVVAIDVRPMQITHKDITFQQVSLEDFLKIKTESFNVIFLRNVVQFLPKDYILNIALPQLAEALLPSGIIAVETFFREPIPAFDKPLRSLYRAQELEESLHGHTVLLSRQHEIDGPDLSGKIRHFCITDFIGQKK